MAFSTNRLLSIDYLISDGGDDLHGTKRPRPTLSLDVNASYDFVQATHTTPDMYLHAPYDVTTPVYYEPHLNYAQITPTGSHMQSFSHPPRTKPGSKNVWETVLMTGNFPNDTCLSENPACQNKDDGGNPMKQGRWTNDEKEFAENLIQQVRNGEVLLPPNTSLRKFIAESLQCKAMRVSKKFRSLRSCPSPDGFTDDRLFNPLSLNSIMNEDACFDSLSDDMDASSPKRGSKTLKRSDYSQHGAVRSGRWSVEEDNYAKAMIEAFKAGYLPLHGNVSLRKFLSEVLVCHPMRISKKFVGYVRKYHWYRIAAGKCNPEAKHLALQQLCQLEQEFWASMEQNQEWVAIQQENRR